MKMKLREFLAKNEIAQHGLIEYRLVDHEDYAAWKDSDHFPGYSGEYHVQSNRLKITADDGSVQTISLNTEGEENTQFDIGGFLFASENERVLLVFSE